MKIIVFAVGCMLIAGLAFAADVDGNWEGETMVMNQPTKMAFTFKADGEKLTGTAPGPSGPVKIEDGKIKGNKLSFKFSIDWQQMKMTFKYKGVFSGDEIKLTYETDMGGGMGGGQAPKQELTVKRVK
jgi:hypothetical protein